MLDKKKQGKTDELRFFGNNQTGEGEWGKDNYQQLFDAVSENPAAAGEVMDHNYDFVQGSLYNTGPWKVDEPKGRGKAFFNMVNAATVTLKQTNPSLAEKNTGRILFDNYQNRKGKDGKGHPIKGTQALYEHPHRILERPRTRRHLSGGQLALGKRHQGQGRGEVREDHQVEPSGLHEGAGLRAPRA